MHHDLRMVSVASKDDSESAADTASDRTRVTRVVTNSYQATDSLFDSKQTSLPHQYNNKDHFLQLLFFLLSQNFLLYKFHYYLLFQK